MFTERLDILRYAEQRGSQGTQHCFFGYKVKQAGYGYPRMYECASLQAVKRGMPGKCSQEPNLLNLYQIDLAQPASPEQASWLSPAEMARARAFHFEHLTQRYIIGRAALRYVLSRHLNCPPSAIEFVQNEWGKPSIAGGPHFNLSHSDDQAMLVVDSESEIGIDLETGTLLLTLDEMQHVLSPEEVIYSQTRHLTAAELLRLWVRKESVLKALGKGVAYDPRLITLGFHPVDFNGWREIRLIDKGISQSFHLVDIDLGLLTCAITRRDAPTAAHPEMPRDWREA